MKTNEEIASGLILRLFGNNTAAVPYRAIKQIEKALDAKDNKWISVDDRLPDHDQVVIVYLKDIEPPVWIARYTTNQGFDCFHKMLTFKGEVIHWQSLSLPQENKK